jgi:hypothetical protein
MIATVLLHKPFEARPRNMLQKIVKNAILMLHGFDPLSCPDESPNPLNKEESMPCSLSNQSKPDSRGLEPRIQARNEGAWVGPRKETEIELVTTFFDRKKQL